MKDMHHKRLANPALGDDPTLTRYVRTHHTVPTAPARRRSPKIPGLVSPFVDEGRTKFSRSVKSPADVPNVLVSGHSNIKIGRDVRKGWLKGYWIYVLSLEERKTCPSTCDHWQDCYGNNMPFAKRIDHTHPDFLSAIERDLERLTAIRGRKGILVRLHALGDFFSVGYVEFWNSMLARFPTLAVYGYTARNPFSDIGLEVSKLRFDYGRRAMIRFSDYNGAQMSTASILEESARPSNAFVCPEQTGRSMCCATCGACWSTAKNVAFISH